MPLVTRLKNAYHNCKEAVNSVKESCNKLKTIAQPFFKRITQENISFPKVHIKINKKLFMVFSFVGIHMLEYWVMNVCSKNAALDDNNEHMKNPTIVRATLNQFWIAIGNILISTSLFSLRRAYSFYVRSSFEGDIKDQMAESWLSNNTSSGLAYFQEVNSGEVLPICDIFSKHITGCARGIAMSITLVSDLISVIVNLYTLGRLFNPRLAMFALMYGVSTATIARIVFGRSYQDLAVKVNKYESEINSKVTDLEKFGQQVIAFNGERLELDRLMVVFRQRESLAKKALYLEIKGEFYHGTLDRIFTPLLDICFPELQGFLVANRAAYYYFNRVLQDVISRMDGINTKLSYDVPGIMVSIDQVTKFNNLMEKWYHFRNQQLLIQKYDPNNSKVFSIEKLKVHIPSKEKKDSLDRAAEILKNPNLLYGKENAGINIQFQKGTVYLFPDFSGKGKTTVLKSFLGMYPYTKGKIVYPCRRNEIRFVSRNTFLPTKNTLLESIISPQETPKDKKEYDALIRTISNHIDKIPMLNGDKHKKNLTEKSDWLNTLSDGEKQSFAIISILLNKPKILILDEAFGGLDKPSKSEVEWLLKKQLPETIILYADHHPIRGFADYAVRIKDGELVITDVDEELDRIEAKLNAMIMNTRKETRKKTKVVF